MFTIDTVAENGFTIIRLKDADNGTAVEVVPASGAILHAFKIEHKGELLNIIDNYPSKAAFDSDVEALGFKSCKLSPFVCRMRDGSYHFGEKKYTVNKFFLGNHALHGLLYDATYELVGTNATSEFASAELLYSYNAGDKGYPFKYDCRVLYELRKGNTLSIKTFIRNKESTAIPVADGWHPYFTFGGSVDDLEMQFNCSQMLEFDDELLPTGKKLPSTLFNKLSTIGNTELDNSFLVNPNNPTPTAVLRDVSKKIQLEIIADKSYPILQVYIPGHRKSIALENLSAAPDAFNNNIGLTILPAGKEVQFSTTYKIVAV